ncbi:hypothetical protein [Pelagibius sp.]|uniref:hypothetical protein n=1 Tax=Pelagibius sp. TaxID=1931238 RepID=UPI002619BF5E|nr:hypothetical protein [Pelagibius sp.]
MEESHTITPFAAGQQPCRQETLKAGETLIRWSRGDPERGDRREFLALVGNPAPSGRAR